MSFLIGVGLGILLNIGVHALYDWWQVRAIRRRMLILPFLWFGLSFAPCDTRPPHALRLFGWCVAAGAQGEGSVPP